MILRIAGGRVKNGITSCHARRQLGAIEGYFGPIPPQNQRGPSRPRIIRGLINPLQIFGDVFAILPSADVQGMAHQMHDSGLDGRIRECDLSP